MNVCNTGTLTNLLTFHLTLLTSPYCVCKFFFHTIPPFYPPLVFFLVCVFFDIICNELGNRKKDRKINNLRPNQPANQHLTKHLTDRTSERLKQKDEKKPVSFDWFLMLITLCEVFCARTSSHMCEELVSENQRPLA